MNKLAFARSLYDKVLGWYHSADTKAQVILAIDGAFIAFVSSAVFLDPEELGKIVGSFSLFTWVILLCMVLTLLGSIAITLVLFFAMAGSYLFSVRS
jgi:hypothetical protein